MSWTIYRTETFLRTARKFLGRHPDLKPEFIDLLRQLKDDPSAPRLRAHPLQGKHAGKRAVSLTYSFRVVITVQIRGKKVILLDIGSHAEVYR